MINYKNQVKLYDVLMLYQEHLVWGRFELTTLVMIGTDYTGSYKSNYHTIMTAPTYFYKGIKPFMINYKNQVKLYDVLNFGLAFGYPSFVLEPLKYVILQNSYKQIWNIIYRPSFLSLKNRQKSKI
jgi:hypothetical protein